MDCTQKNKLVPVNQSKNFSDNSLKVSWHHKGVGFDTKCQVSMAINRRMKVNI